MLFNTRITDLFGIEVPFICGGMMWLADHDYVGAVVNAGSVGFITPRSYPTPEDFRAGLQKCREITGGKPFGVNFYIAARPEANELLQTYLDISIDEGVRFAETAGFSPKAFVPKMKDAGMTVIHKCTTLRHAQSAERAGVDAIIILGAEAGGHPGMDMIGGMIQGATVPQGLDVPVVLAGGIGSGQQIVAALALGVDGVLLASRMIVAAEIWANDAYKKRLLEIGASDTKIIMSIFGDNSRVIDNPDAAKVRELEAQGVTDFEQYRPYVQGIVQKESYTSGDWQRGTMSLGQSVQFADRIEPVAAIFGRLMDEARAARDRLAGL